VANGALEVDVRPSGEFVAAHRRGALSVPLGSSFLTWAGSVIPADHDLVITCSIAQRHAAERAVRDLALIGIDRVLGVLAEDGPHHGRDESLASLASVPASAIGNEAPRGVTVLDVRNRSEWDEGHVPGARLLPLPELTSRLDELRDVGPIIVHCQGGSRSVVAASVLQAAGIRDVTNVEGGLTAWLRAGHTPVRGA
jgi:hydroxyacylglutathione hydrolase